VTCFLPRSLVLLASTSTCFVGFLFLRSERDYVIDVFYDLIYFDEWRAGMRKGPDGEAWPHPVNMCAFSGRAVCLSLYTGAVGGPKVRKGLSAGLSSTALPGSWRVLETSCIAISVDIVNVSTITMII